MKSKYSQNALILKHLKRHSITMYHAAYRYNCFRLSGRIYDLKHGIHDGKCWPIKTKMIDSGGKHFARYSLPR